MTVNPTLAPTPTPTHTPGPWYAQGRYILSDPLHPSIACATVLKAPSLALEPQFEAQAHANARLLAAAPDMLHALRLMLREHAIHQLTAGSTGDIWPAVTLARNILDRLGEE